MSLEGFQLRVERIIASVLGEKGFALGSGQALRVYEVINRESKDLDHYTETMDALLFDDAEAALIQALSIAGLHCESAARDSWFRQILVTEPQTHNTLSVDLGYDYRERLPVAVEGIGPVLHLHDVVVGKVRALSDRRAERDYVDIDAILSSGEWTVRDLWTALHLIRPEWTLDRFVSLLKAAESGDQEEYVALGMSHQQIIDMSNRLSTAADSLSSSSSTVLLPTTRQQPLPVSAIRCDICGRPLHSAVSVARKRGPSCARNR